MQIDKLVQLLESPAFVHLRLQLLDVESPYHAPLLKSCYGLLMLLPQSDAFRSLNDRLATVCNLRDNLAVAPSMSTTSSGEQQGLTERQVELLKHFDRIRSLHHKMSGKEAQLKVSGELRITTANATKLAARVIAGGSTSSVFYDGNSHQTSSKAGGRTQEV